MMNTPEVTKSGKLGSRRSGVYPKLPPPLHGSPTAKLPCMTADVLVLSVWSVRGSVGWLVAWFRRTGLLADRIKTSKLPSCQVFVAAASRH